MIFVHQIFSATRLLGRTEHQNAPVFLKTRPLATNRFLTTTADFSKTIFWQVCFVRRHSQITILQKYAFEMLVLCVTTAHLSNICNLNNRQAICVSFNYPTNRNALCRNRKPLFRMARGCFKTHSQRFVANAQTAVATLLPLRQTTPTFQQYV